MKSPSPSKRVEPELPRPARAPWLEWLVVVLIVAGLGVGLALELQPEAPPWASHLLHAAVMLAAALLLLCGSGTAAPPAGSWRARLAGGRPRRIALGVLALLAAFAFTNFGRFHGDGRVLHHHELFNYSIGSKYFDELGYDGLYVATHRALLENDPSLAEEITVVKNLRTYQMDGARTNLERGEGLVATFSASRWAEFRADVGRFQTLIPRAGWQLLLVDHGYNATPFWTALGQSLVADQPLDPQFLERIAWIDPLLIAAMLALVAWAFGLETALLFVIFFGANFFATYDFTGGAFLRQLWFLGLIAYVCCWKRGYLALAGVALAAATLDRIFPVLFGLPAAIAFGRATWQHRGLRHEWTRCLVGFGATALLLFAWGAAATGGVATWLDCIANASRHSSWYFINQVSLRSLFLFDPGATSDMLARGWDESVWLRQHQLLDHTTAFQLALVRGALVGALAWRFLREKKPFELLGLTAFLPFVLLYPANYYYGFLVLFVLLHRSQPLAAALVLGLQSLFWILRSFLPPPLQLEQLHYWVSLGLLGALVLFLAAPVLGRRRAAAAASTQPKATRLPSTRVLGFLLLAVIVGLAYRSARRVPSVVSPLDVGPADVSSLVGLRATATQMERFGTGWASNDHIDFGLPAGDAETGKGAAVTLHAPRPGRYVLTVSYSTAPSFGIIALRVGEQDPGAPIDLYSPRVGLRRARYLAVELAETTPLWFQVVAKHADSSGEGFAIDRIAFEPQEDFEARLLSTQGRTISETVFERALAWLLQHPSDNFDGGRRGTCEELELLQLAWEKGVLERPALKQAIEARLARLDGQPGDRTSPYEANALVAAAQVARRQGTAFRAFDRVVDALQTAYGSAPREAEDARAFATRIELERLEASDPSSYQPSLSESALATTTLFRESRGRELLAITRGPLDPAQLPWVSGAFFSLTEEALALSDHGRQPLASRGIFTDVAFWSKLAQQGLAWASAAEDPYLLARCLLFADALGVTEPRPVFEAHIERLATMQLADGSFDDAQPSAANARRGAVLAAAAAFLVGLEGTPLE